VSLLLGGSKPTMIRQMLLPVTSKGVISKPLQIPGAQYRAFIEPLVEVLENTETLREEDVQSLHDAIPQGDEEVELRVRYNPNSDTLRIRILQDGKGIYIRGTMHLTTEEMDMVNISTDEVQYNLLDLDEAVVEEMRDELDYMGFKLDSFVANSNMRKLSGNGGE